MQNIFRFWPVKNSGRYSMCTEIHELRQKHADFPFEEKLLAVHADVIECKKMVDMPFEIGSATVVSERLLNLVDKFGDIEAIPVHFSSITFTSSPYYIIRPRTWIECADKEKSRRISVDWWGRFVVDERLVPGGCHVFGAKGTISIYVDAMVKAECERLKISGVTWFE